MTNNLHALIRQKEIREGRRVSVRTIAQETGLSYYTLNALARDRLNEYPRSVIVSLCTYFGCDVGDLLTIVDLPNEPESEGDNAH